MHKCAHEWGGKSTYPMVPGHEAIGTVLAVGAEVTNVKVGQTVGFGPQRSSCRTCEFCVAGDDNCCLKFEGLYDPKFGGYATSITCDARFAFPIPEGIPLQLAGPLLCAGITTYAPLSRYVKRGDRVGIVGIGGLGHMGLQYAAAMGTRVVAITTSAAKEAEARSFGAAEILVSTDAAAMEAAKNSFDFILCCASGNFKVATYTALLKPTKAFCLVGLPSIEAPLTFEPFHIVDGQRTIVGSMIGGTTKMKEMLAFSAEHKIYPQCEIIPFAKAQDGFAKIIANSARYRMVLDMAGVREAPPA